MPQPTDLHHAGHVWDAPARTARSELRVRGSRFLAEVAAVDSFAAAATHLQQLKQEFPRATHHCWGARVWDGTAVAERCADGGEPSGSAGAPILRALAAARLEGASLVVVRWFGGTKLGVGPLGRAYRQVAAAAIAAAGSEPRCHQRIFRIRFPHAVSAEIRRVAARLGARIRAEHHGAEAELEVCVPLDRAAALQQAIAEASRGQAHTVGGDVIAARTGS